MTNYTLIKNRDITSYLSDKAFRLYSLLQSMAYGDKITCYPSQKYMAVALRCSVRTIQRALVELKDAGLISIRRRGSVSNIYTLLQKKVQQVVEKVEKAVERVKKAYNQNKSYKSNYRKDERPNFNDYNQRKYNYKNLEDMFQGKLDYDPDILYQT